MGRDPNWWDVWLVTWYCIGRARLKEAPLYVQSRYILEQYWELSPEERFREMVRRGVITEDGQPVGKKEEE